jgi:hypothetical protein
LHEETLATLVKARTTHGESSGGRFTAEYLVWVNMIARCERPSVQRFKHYGGRGITVCERWRKNYIDFLADMGRKPSPKHSLDRIDVNGNCRWATASVQRLNQRPRLPPHERVSE